MGRYTTVQSYSDNNANVRAISYEQARGTSSGGGGGGGAASGAAASAASSGDVGGGAGGTVRADKVYNPYGSTAGAGSGEFHIYRHARSREMARMKALDDAEETARADREFEQTVETWKDEEERKTAKRRKKRKREKEARERKKNLKLSGIAVGADGNDGDNNGSSAAGMDDDEFEYVPMQQQQQQPAQDIGTSKSDEEKPSAVEDTKEGSPKEESVEVPAVPFANDGSFLAMMKKKLAEEEEAEAKVSGDGDNSKEAGGDINTTKDTAE